MGVWAIYKVAVTPNLVWQKMSYPLGKKSSELQVFLKKKTSGLFNVFLCQATNCPYWQATTHCKARLDEPVIPVLFACGKNSI